MTQINIKISNAVATSEKNGILTAGMVGVPVKFTFDSGWDGLAVTAVFSGSGVEKSVPLLGATDTVVPWEVMVQPNTRLRIGVEGRLTDGTLVITTTWAIVGTLMPGANATDDLAKPPTPTAFDRILSLIGNMDDLTTEAKDSLVAAINEAMTKGGGEIDPEAVQQIVDEYLAQNPPSDGVDGKDGITPTIGDNGNWYLGNTDTGKPSRGEPGPVGAIPNIQIGTVETLPAGSPATASMTGTPENPLLNMGIPKGQTGDAGKSAYQYAVEGGYAGTEEEFAAKLANEMPDKLPNPHALTFTGAVTGIYDGSAPLSVEIPESASEGVGSKPSVIFDSGEITEEVNIIGPIDISKYSKIRILGKAYPSANSSGKRAAQIYFQNIYKRLLCNAGNGKLFDTAGNPVSFLIYLDVGANAISTHSYSGFNASGTFDDVAHSVSSQASNSDGGCLVYSTKYDLTQMHLSAQDDLSGRPWGVNTRIMVIGDA